MEKARLRTNMIAELKALTLEQKLEIEANLTKHTLTSSYWQQADIVGLTIAQAFEWDTQPLIAAAWAQGKTVVIPKCSPKQKELVFYTYQPDEELEIVYMDLLEPKAIEANKVTKKQIDLLVVPGLLFDKDGYRIGFGGGYYDRYLNGYPNRTLSLVSQIQLIEDLPTHAFDLPVDQLVTETGIIA